jgi:prevent-host-death family protein
MRHKLIAISKAKAKLLELTRKVSEDGAAYILTKDGEAIGALVPMEDYESLLETSDLLTDQKIMKNLEAALKDEKSNNLWKRDKGGKWIKLAKKKSAA